MKECRFYQKVDGEGEYASDTVRCQLCPHCCVILGGKHGKCGSRWNFNGMLYSVVYGKPCALADDPVEKKPLNEFHPGTRCLSLSCTGCNFRCLNCQNHDISQVLPSAVDFYELSPSDIVDIAVKHHCRALPIPTRSLLPIMSTSMTSPRRLIPGGFGISWYLLVTSTRSLLGR